MEAKDAALEYEAAVYKWKVAKDRAKALEAEEAKAKVGLLLRKLNFGSVEPSKA